MARAGAEGGEPGTRARAGVTEEVAPIRRRLDVVVALIQGHRYTWQSERELCDHLERVFQIAGLPYAREYRLSAADRPDFMIGDVAVEVKVAGSLEAALRQCERYTHHDKVGGIVLATSRARHRITPEESAATLTWAKPLHFAWVRAK